MNDLIGLSADLDALKYANATVCIASHWALYLPVTTHVQANGDGALIAPTAARDWALACLDTATMSWSKQLLSNCAAWTSTRSRSSSVQLLVSSIRSLRTRAITNANRVPKAC